jgi:hypothetical protein
MQMRRALALLMAITLVTAVPAAARSARARAPQPWATVNRCDTTAHPNQIGIRASMPGLARRTTMFMRFRVQYQDGAAWRTIEQADSGWSRVARGRRGDYDAGWTFGFDPPAAGGALVLRGRVSYQWRRARRAVRRERRLTAAGHPATAGADPADFSAATCPIA